MQMQIKSADTGSHDCQFDEELADVLTAISVVSKRLARKLDTLSSQNRKTTEEGKTDE